MWHTSFSDKVIECCGAAGTTGQVHQFTAHQLCSLSSTSACKAVLVAYVYFTSGVRSALHLVPGTAATSR